MKKNTDNCIRYHFHAAGCLHLLFSKRNNVVVIQIGQQDAL